MSNGTGNSDVRLWGGRFADGPAEALAKLIARDPPEVVLNTTAFSARCQGSGTVLDGADAPVLQVIQSGSDRAAWASSDRGLRAADLAMTVVLPEVDGRVLAGAISFKEAGTPDAAREFAPVNDRIQKLPGTGADGVEQKRQSRELLSRISGLYGALGRWTGAPTKDQLSRLAYYQQMVKTLVAKQ